MTNGEEKYIIIVNLSNPQKVFEELESKFIDIMYPDYIHEDSLVMLLDVNIEPEKEEDFSWLKELLDDVLPKIGERNYDIAPL